MKKSTATLTRSAIIAAIYVILSLVLQPIAFGPIQFRISEALVMLPLIFPESIIGVTIGCALSNIASPLGILDIGFGTLATLTAAVLTWVLRKKPIVAGLPPVLANAFIIPLVFVLSKMEESYLLSALTIGLSEAIVVYLLGIPLAKLVKKLIKR